MTPKREKFCQAIVDGKSQTEAYRKAYRAKGMKAATIHKRANELMDNGEIKGRIAEIRGPVVDNLRWSLEDRMKELRYAGELDPLDIYDEHGMPKAMKDIPVHARRAISGWEIDPEKFTTKIKTVDKRGAIMDYTKLAGDMPVEITKVQVGITVEHLVGLIKRKEPKVING